MYDINYQADTLNSSDLLKRLNYLENQIEENKDDFFDYDELDELRAHEDTLKQLADNGTILINSDYFDEYIQENLKKSGALSGIPKYIVIDWKGTVNGILPDYSGIDLNDEVFFYL